MAQWVIALLMFLTGWVGSADAADQSLSPPPRLRGRRRSGILFTSEKMCCLRSSSLSGRSPRRNGRTPISRRLLSVARDPFAETAEINVLEVTPARTSFSVTGS